MTAPASVPSIMYADYALRHESAHAYAASLLVWIESSRNSILTTVRTCPHSAFDSVQCPRLTEGLEIALHDALRAQ
jgi:hypothetical protein